jgi:hypothetical protein
MKARNSIRDDLLSQNSQFSSMTAAVAFDRDLTANGMSDKDLEIEHLQTQIMAYIQKGTVVDDLKKDLEAANAMLKESQEKREALQREIKERCESFIESAQEEKER